jgi:HD superfamily phosphodiesterase
VLALAERIGRAEGADLAIVRPAALLHDVGREKAEAGGLDHAAFAADRAREILSQHRPEEPVLDCLEVPVLDCPEEPMLGCPEVPVLSRIEYPAPPVYGGAEPHQSGRTGAVLLESAGAGLPPAQVEAVAHAIAAHRFRAGPEPSTLEAQVLFDADKLDAIGAVGVARAFAYGGAHGQRLWAPVETVDVARWLEEGDHPRDHTPVHEFVVKLSRLKERLFTPTGRAIAEERHAYMVTFFERFDAEARGEQ